MMTTAQSLLIFGGLVNILASIVIAYALYWIRLRDVQRPTGGGLVSHKVTLWNGFLLFSLAVAIEYTGFSDQVNTGLALAEVIISFLASGRTVILWARRTGNVFLQPGFMARSIGLGHIVDLVVIAGILYGVTRTYFGF